MALVTIEGAYENGTVRLAETPVGIERARVMVTFLPESPVISEQKQKKDRKERKTTVRDVVVPVMPDPYPQALRDEYKALIQQKLRRLLTEEGAARLDAVRDEINRLDRQTETWSAAENGYHAVEQELAQVRRELEALPDA
jgi:hypothetical protein